MIVEEAGTLGQRIITLSWSQGPLTQLRQHDVMVGMNDGIIITAVLLTSDWTHDSD